MLPPFLVIGLPLANLAALLAIQARYNRDGDWLALRASGVSPGRLLGAALLPTGVLALLILVLTHWAAPNASGAFMDLIHDQGARALSARLRPGNLVDLGNGNTIFVREETASGEWRGFFWSNESGSGRLAVWALAGKLIETGRGMRLRLFNGGWDVTGGGGQRSAGFDRLSVNVTSLLRNTRVEEIFPPWQILDSFRLKRRLASCDPGSAQRRRMQAEFGRRSSTALAAFVLGIFGLALGRRRWLSRNSAAYALAAGVALGYYLFERLGMIMGEKEIWSAWAGPWLPLMALLPITVGLWLKREG